jgi:hypothetical protein
VALRIGQVIAIDVLTRHVETSSGKCQSPAVSYTSSCIMADALRDRFTGLAAQDGVNVGTSNADLYFADGSYVNLSAHSDMEGAIRAFDDVIDEVRAERISLKDAFRELRDRIPRVVHATVYDVGN